MKFLFGPVPSRRLGISLGVDLVPHKVCTLNCIYCEVGRTTNLTVERKEYVPVAEVKRELSEYLSQSPELDFITFSGQGEPTLNSGLGEIIDFIKQNYPRYRVALITNGTLFCVPEVRSEVKNADVILPSLDAVSPSVFSKINRPAKNLNNESIIEGLIQLRKEFSGEIFLEVFFVPQINENEEELKLLKETITLINPDLIQLNTLDRPGTEEFVKAVSPERMQEIKDFFEPLSTQVISKSETRKKIKSFNDSIEEQILETVKRRPCTDHDLTEILNLHLNELNKYLGELIDSGKIIAEKQGEKLFFKINQSFTYKENKFK